MNEGICNVAVYLSSGAAILPKIGGHMVICSTERVELVPWVFDMPADIAVPETGPKLPREDCLLKLVSGPFQSHCIFLPHQAILGLSDP